MGDYEQGKIVELLQDVVSQLKEANTTLDAIDMQTNSLAAIESNTSAIESNTNSLAAIESNTWSAQ